MNHLVKRLEVKGNNLGCWCVCVYIKIFALHFCSPSVYLYSMLLKQRNRRHKPSLPVQVSYFKSRAVYEKHWRWRFSIVTILQVEYNYPFELYGRRSFTAFFNSLYNFFRGGSVSQYTNAVADKHWAPPRKKNNEKQKRHRHTMNEEKKIMSDTNCHSQQKNRKKRRLNEIQELMVMVRSTNIYPNENYYTIFLVCANEEEKKNGI